MTSSPGPGEEPKKPSPLLLRELRIKRLRSLYDVGPIPVKRDLTVLTGENDGGKSATIDALGFLLGSYAPQPVDVSHWASEGETLEVEGVFVAIDDRGEQAPIHMRSRLEPSGRSIREIRDRVHSGMGMPPSSTTLPELRARMGALGIPVPGGSAKQPYVEAAEHWLAERPDGEFEERWRQATQQELARMPTFTRFTSVTAPSPTGHITAVVSREARRLLKEEKYSVRLGTLGGDLDADIAASLERIKTKIQEYCPDLDGVEIAATFDFTSPQPTIHVNVRRQGKAVDLEKAGEGRRRRVALAIHEANLKGLAEGPSTSSELIAYDEPDTHLDYASQRSLFMILDRQAQLPHVQVAVATHSLNFIDRVPLDVIVHFRLGKDLRTAIEMLSGTSYRDEVQFLATLGTGLGLRNSVLLDERCFLVVEGETEEAAVPGLFRVVTGHSMTASGITIVNTKGSRSARRIVELLVREWKRASLVLGDRDQRDELLAWSRTLGFAEGREVHFVGTQEFEDAFSDEVWLLVLRSGFPTGDGEGEWSIEEIRAVRAEREGKYSDRLCGLVRRRCRDHTIGKPDLGEALGRLISEAGGVPGELSQCFRVLVEMVREESIAPGRREGEGV